MANERLTIVVDAPSAPSSDIDGVPAYAAHLWPGNKTSGARPDKAKAITAVSTDSPKAAVAFAIDLFSRRPKP